MLLIVIILLVAYIIVPAVLISDAERKRLYSSAKVLVYILALVYVLWGCLGAGKLL